MGEVVFKITLMKDLTSRKIIFVVEIIYPMKLENFFRIYYLKKFLCHWDLFPISIFTYTVNGEIYNHQVYINLGDKPWNEN